MVTMRWLRPAGWLACGVVAVGLVLAGCAAEAPDTDDGLPGEESPALTTEQPEDPYAEEIAQAQAGEMSDFEREVMADGQVTREEYDEAHELWLQCMEDAYPPETGVIVGLEADQDGLYSYAVHVPANLRDTFDHDARDRITELCSRGTIEMVAGFYNSMVTNPDNSPYDEMVLACLHDRGLVEDWYTMDHVKADLDKNTTGVIIQGPDGTTTHPPPPVDEDFITDLDMYSDEVLRCR